MTRTTGAIIRLSETDSIHINLGDGSPSDLLETMLYAPLAMLYREKVVVQNFNIMSHSDLRMERFPPSSLLSFTSDEAKLTDKWVHLIPSGMSASTYLSMLVGFRPGETQFITDKSRPTFVVSVSDDRFPQVVIRATPEYIDCMNEEVDMFAAKDGMSEMKAVNQICKNFLERGFLSPGINSEVALSFGDDDGGWYCKWIPDIFMISSISMDRV